MEQLYYSPGQLVTFFLEITDGYYNHRVDSTTTPIVSRIILPDLTDADGFPQNLTKIDTGLYYYQYTAPTGAAAIGSYLIDMQYTNPIDQETSAKSVNLIITSPVGLFSVTSF
jgi:hypothetical protein